MRSSLWLACCTTLLTIATSTAARVAAGEAPVVARPATDMQLTALSKDDITLYLQVMHAAADRVRQPTADDKAVLAQYDASKAATKAGKQSTSEDLRVMQRAERLKKDMDGVIVQERHIDLRRYVGIASVIEDVVGPPRGPGLFIATIGRGAPTDNSAASTSVRQQIKAVEAQDAPMLAPHRAEIQQLMAVLRNHPPAW